MSKVKNLAEKQSVKSFSLKKDVSEKLQGYASSTGSSQSWIVEQALKQYFERYDEHMSDSRILSLSRSEAVDFEEVLKEYGFQDKV